MEIRVLIYFLTVVREQSITKAARKRAIFAIHLLSDILMLFLRTPFLLEAI